MHETHHRRVIIRLKAAALNISSRSPNLYVWKNGLRIWTTQGFWPYIFCFDCSSRKFRGFGNKSTHFHVTTLKKLNKTKQKTLISVAPNKIYTLHK